jgi:hypothetical protein
MSGEHCRTSRQCHPCDIAAADIRARAGDKTKPAADDAVNPLTLFAEGVDLARGVVGLLKN